MRKYNPMAFSIGAKQNCIYVVLVVLTSIVSIVMYKTLNQDWILFREAETKYNNKEYDAAIVLYKKSVEEGLSSSKVAMNLANSYVAIGNFKEAIDLYRTHLLENPKDTNIRLALARALSWTGNLKESEEEYQKILENTHDKHQDK